MVPMGTDERYGVSSVLIEVFSKPRRRTVLDYLVSDEPSWGRSPEWAREFADAGRIEASGVDAPLELGRRLGDRLYGAMREEIT